MTHHALILEAKEFARTVHANQKRRYSDAPYFEHCDAVAGILGLVIYLTLTKKDETPTNSGSTV